MLIEVAGSLIPGTVNTPLDQRTRVNALSEVSQIENPYVGMKFYCLATGKTYTVKSLKNKLIGSFTVQDAMVDEFVQDPYLDENGKIPQSQLPDSSLIMIADGGDYFEAETVEEALQEIAAQLFESNKILDEV